MVFQLQWKRGGSAGLLAHPKDEQLMTTEVRKICWLCHAGTNWLRCCSNKGFLADLKNTSNRFGARKEVSSISFQHISTLHSGNGFLGLSWVNVLHWHEEVCRELPTIQALQFGFKKSYYWLSSDWQRNSQNMTTCSHVATSLGIVMSWFKVSVLLYNIIDIIVSSMTIVYHLLFRETWRNTSPRATSDSLIKQLGIEHPETRDLERVGPLGPADSHAFRPCSSRNAHVQRGKVLLALAIATCRFLQAVETERDFAASESCKLSMNVLTTEEILINFCSTCQQGWDINNTWYDVNHFAVLRISLRCTSVSIWARSLFSGGARSSRTWPWHLYALVKGQPSRILLQATTKRGSYLLDRLKFSQTVQNYSQESVWVSPSLPVLGTSVSVSASLLVLSDILPGRPKLWNLSSPGEWQILAFAIQRCSLKIPETQELLYTMLSFQHFFLASLLAISDKRPWIVAYTLSPATTWLQVLKEVNPVEASLLFQSLSPTQPKRSRPSSFSVATVIRVDYTTDIRR